MPDMIQNPASRRAVLKVAARLAALAAPRAPALASLAPAGCGLDNAGLPRPQRVPETKERPVLLGRAAHNVLSSLGNFGSQGGIRTPDQAINSRLLYH